MIEIQKHPEQGYLLTTQQLIRRDIEDVFAFFSDACQLEKITPPFLKFRVLSPQPIELKEGALIDYRIRLRRLPLRWRTEICDWKPPFYFSDRQLRGPYRQWFHEHFFESVEGGTLVRDRVHYIVPGGRWVHRWFVKKDVTRIFEYRQQKLDELLNHSVQDYKLGSLVVAPT